MKNYVTLIIIAAISMSGPTTAYSNKGYIAYGAAAALAAAGTATLLSRKLTKPKNNEVRKPEVFSKENRKRLIVATSLYLAALVAGVYGVHQTKSNNANTPGTPALRNTTDPEGPNDPEGPSDPEGPNNSDTPPDSFFNIDDLLEFNDSPAAPESADTLTPAHRAAATARIKGGREALWSLTKMDNEPSRIDDERSQIVGIICQARVEIRAAKAAKLHKDPVNCRDENRTIADCHDVIYQNTLKLSTLAEQNRFKDRALALLTPMGAASQVLATHHAWIWSHDDSSEHAGCRTIIKALYGQYKGNTTFLYLLDQAGVLYDIKMIASEE